MPLYDYRCDSCGHEVEVLQGINDDHLTVCPECGHATFKRQVSAPAFSFKGGGWYKDLYGSAGSGKKDAKSGSSSNSSSSSSSSDSSSTSSSKSETKTAAAK